MDNINSLKEILARIRPLLIKKIHEEKLEEYIQEYKNFNDGTEPDKKLIDECSTILITNKIAVKEADEIIQGIISEIEEIIKQEKRKKKLIIIGVNTLIFAMILNMALTYIASYLNVVMEIDLLKNYDIYNFPNLINAILIILVMLIYYIISITRKDH